MVHLLFNDGLIERGVVIAHERCPFENPCHQRGIRRTGAARSGLLDFGPADGSHFLNSMKLWAMRNAGIIDDYEFDLDLHAEVFEACAYHHWGLFQHPAGKLATLILGGGVPKNYNRQPEPAAVSVFFAAAVTPGMTAPWGELLSRRCGPRRFGR
jgi:hypothetical protein